MEGDKLLHYAESSIAARVDGSGATSAFRKGSIEVVDIQFVLLDHPIKYYDVINADPYNNFLLVVDSGVVVSHNCFFDEISFI